MRWVICLVIMLGLFYVLPISATDTDLVISEILPNPVGDESENEFIEIQNQSDTEFDLTGYYLDDVDGGSTPYLFPTGTKVSAGGYLVFYSKDTHLGLTNTGERARILRNDKSLLTEVLYSDAAEGFSYARKNDGSYEWISALTPGDENIFPTPVPTPTATPSVSPIVSPNPIVAPLPDYSMAKDLLINEVLPDPKGNDGENEFIELFNPRSESINLSGFYLDDAEGGSTAYKISDGTLIASGGYLVFYSKDTKIALNNSGDETRLLAPDKTVLLSLKIDKSPHDDRAYARKQDGGYDWTSEPTPGEENEIVGEMEETPTPKATASPKSTPTPKRTASAKKPPIPTGTVNASDESSVKNYTTRRALIPLVRGDTAPKKVNISDLKKEKIGQTVLVTGIVSQLNIFDPRLIYLSGSGVGVFLVSGQYPRLSIGDKVAISGFLVKPGKELFLSVAKPSDISSVGEGFGVITHDTNIGEIDEEKIGWFVKLEGTARNIANNIFEIEKDNKKITVFVSNNDKKIKEGEGVIVRGILSANGDGMRILASDIEGLRLSQGKYFQVGSVLEHWKTFCSVFCFLSAFIFAFVIYVPPLTKKKEFSA